MSPTLGGSSGSDSFSDRQFIAITSEKAARVIALPSQNCVYRQQIADTDYVVKAEIISLKGNVFYGALATSPVLNVELFPISFFLAVFVCAFLPPLHTQAIDTIAKIAILSNENDDDDDDGVIYLNSQRNLSIFFFLFLSLSRSGNFFFFICWHLIRVYLQIAFV